MGRRRAGLGLPHHNFQLTWVLAAVNVVIYIILQVLPTTGNVLFYHPALVLHGELWRLLSFVTLNTPLLGLIFSTVGLIMFGHDVEERLGSWEFLIFYAGISVLTAGFILLVYVLSHGAVGAILVGCATPVIALSLAYASFAPHSVISLLGLLPLPAPIAVIVWGGLNVVLILLQAGPAQLLILVAYPLAWLYVWIVHGINFINHLRRS